MGPTISTTSGTLASRNDVSPTSSSATHSVRSIGEYHEFNHDENGGPADVDVSHPRSGSSSEHGVRCREQGPLGDMWGPSVINIAPEYSYTYTATFPPPGSDGRRRAQHGDERLRGLRRPVRRDHRPPDQGHNPHQRRTRNYNLVLKADHVPSDRRPTSTSSSMSERAQRV